MNLKLFLQISVMIFVVLAVLGFSGNTIDKIAHFLYAVVLVSIILSGIIGSVIEKFGGDFLKKYSYNFKVYGVNFSVTVFALLVMIIKFFIIR